MAYQGDLWILAYASIPPVAVGPCLFSIGHALELYLKATYGKLSGDIDEAIGFGHDLKGLWDDCKKLNKDFMCNYEIKKSIYSGDFLDKGFLDKLTKTDRLHFIENQSLYIILKHLQDLKYIGLTWKTRKKRLYGIGQVHPDPFWIDFFKDLQSFLGYPPKGKKSNIAMFLESEHFPANVVLYLRGLI